jgi:hypothetical protein
MALYELKQEDINSIRSLISAEALSISANLAKRVAYLQVLLEQAQPSAALDECKARCKALEREVQECLRVRDNALLEAGVLKRRIEEAGSVSLGAATIEELETEDSA